MKKFCHTLAFASNLLICAPIYAQPHQMGMGGGPGQNFMHNGPQQDGFSNFNNRGYSSHQEVWHDLQQIRKVQEEQGFERLKQLKWQAGYTMPQHYRSDRYKVNYIEYNLPRPERDQQWYRINNDFLLINASNTIVNVQ